MRRAEAEVDGMDGNSIKLNCLCNFNFCICFIASTTIHNSDWLNFIVVINYFIWMLVGCLLLNYNKVQSKQKNNTRNEKKPTRRTRTIRKENLNFNYFYSYFYSARVFSLFPCSLWYVVGSDGWFCSPPHHI